MTSFDYLQQRQQSLRESQRFRTLIPREREGVYLVESNGRHVLDFGSNDYLGLAMEMRGRGDKNALPKTSFGELDSKATAGSGASALLSGWSMEHELLSKLSKRGAKKENSSFWKLFVNKGHDSKLL